MESITAKRCSKCGQEKPETLEFFGPSKQSATGLKHRCRVCLRAQKREWDARAEESKRQNADARAERDRLASQGSKRCDDCQEVKAFAEFAKEKLAPNGRTNICKLCKGARYATRKLSAAPDFGTAKQCGKCGGIFPRSPEHFVRNNRAADGLNLHCKECTRVAARAFYAENTDHVRAANRASRQRHLEQRRQDVRDAYRQRMAIPELAEKERQSKRESQAKRLREDPAFRLRRREESRLRSQRASADPVKRQVLNERSRNYFQRNRETQLAKQREYNRLNPEKIREQNARTRARRQNLEGEYTGHDLKRILLAQGFKCFYCGDVIRNGPRAWHADHFIPVARGGTNHPENIVIACAGCNLSKHDKLPWEWMPERFSPGPSQMS